MLAETCILHEKQGTGGWSGQCSGYNRNQSNLKKPLWKAVCMSGDKIMKRLVLGSVLLRGKETLLLEPPGSIQVWLNYERHQEKATEDRG